MGVLLDKSDSVKDLHSDPKIIRGSVSITGQNDIKVYDPAADASWYDFDYTYEYYALR